jgi:hypothetical protein
MMVNPELLGDTKRKFDFTLAVGKRYSALRAEQKKAKEGKKMKKHQSYASAIATYEELLANVTLDGEDSASSPTEGAETAGLSEGSMSSLTEGESDSSVGSASSVSYGTDTVEEEAFGWEGHERSVLKMKEKESEGGGRKNRRRKRKGNW